MDSSAPSLGIWGLGITGKAAVAYLSKHHYRLSVFDERILTDGEKQFLADHHVQIITSLTTFLTTQDVILPSAGIDLRPYHAYSHKWLNELDLFYAAWRKPIIAITGTVGKTSVTHLLSQLLANLGLHVALGGNIGIGMLSLIAQQEKSDLALLEVSSFQLERAAHFAPTLAIWTNFAPNHLDQHSSLEEYFAAKANIFAHQKSPKNHALLGLSVREHTPNDELFKRPMSYFSVTAPTPKQRAKLHDQDALFFIENNFIYQEHGGKKTPLVDCAQLPACSFTENWLALVAVLTLHGITPDRILAACNNLTLPAHRLEKVATVAGTIFYNDSKSTTPTSTLAAIAQLGNTPIHLFLGGLGKGIDRTPLIKALPDSIVAVYCFGKEAEQLNALCTEYHKKSAAYQTLEEAFTACTNTITTGNTVLFSPSGSSYDLFKNFEERGTIFKQLVQSYALSKNV